MNKRVTYMLLIAGAAAFALMVKHLGIAAIVSHVDKVKWWFIPIVAVWGIVYACNSWATYMLINHRTEEVSYGAVFQATVSSFALNYITPFLNLGGEPYRAAILKPYIGGPRAVSAVVSYNIVRMMGHCIFWLFVGVIAVVFVPMTYAALGILFITLCAVMALLLLFATMQKEGFLERTWLRLEKFFRSGRRKGWFEAKTKSLHTIDESVRSVYAKNPKGFYRAITIETVSRLIATLEFVFIMQGIWGTPSYRDALLLNGASSLVLNLLFFIPFELGTREGSLYLILHFIGYPAALGIFIGLINRARELVWILIGLALMPLGPGQLERWRRITLNEAEEKT